MRLIVKIMYHRDYNHHADADQQREVLYSDIHIYMHITHILWPPSLRSNQLLKKDISDLDLYIFLSPNSIIICSRKLLSDIVSFWKICMTCSSWMYDFFTTDIYLYTCFYCFWEDRRHKKNIGILLLRIKSASGGSFFSIST